MLSRCAGGGERGGGGLENVLLPGSVLRYSYSGKTDRGARIGEFF